MLIGGIDEAGRGPVIGPMVIVGVEAEEKEIERLPVRDSKTYSKRAREKKFFEVLLSIRRVHVRIVSPEEIDSYVEKGKLNSLEAEYFSSIISEMRAKKVYIDAFSNPAELALKALKIPSGKEVICEHLADRKYKVVSAASVVAKVIRDKVIEEISEELGEEIGSGYPSDPLTVSFLKSWVEEKGDLPPWTRRSWETSKRLIKRDMRLF